MAVNLDVVAVVRVGRWQHRISTRIMAVARVLRMIRCDKQWSVVRKPGIAAVVRGERCSQSEASNFLVIYIVYIWRYRRFY